MIYFAYMFEKQSEYTNSFLKSFCALERNGKNICRININ